MVMVLQEYSIDASNICCHWVIFFGGNKLWLVWMDEKKIKTGKHHLFNGYGEEMERKCATKFIWSDGFPSLKVKRICQQTIRYKKFFENNNKNGLGETAAALVFTHSSQSDNPMVVFDQTKLNENSLSVMDGSIF